MPPLPILIAAIILLGYPLIQIVAIRVRRPWRERFNALAAEMLADPTLTRSERRMIEYYKTASRGDAGTWWRYVRTPVLVFLSEVSGVEEEPVRVKTARDAQFKELSNLAITLEWATYPIGCILMMGFAVPLLFCGWLIGWARGANGRQRLDLSEIRRVATFGGPPMAGAV